MELNTHYQEKIMKYFLENNAKNVKNNLNKQKLVV